MSKADRRNPYTRQQGRGLRSRFRFPRSSGRRYRYVADVKETPQGFQMKDNLGNETQVTVTPETLVMKDMKTGEVTEIPRSKPTPENTIVTNRAESTQ